MSSPEVVVNVYCEPKGWLFDDLRSGIGRRRRVTSTNHPDLYARAWICIRTREFLKSPNKRRTVLQVHDIFDNREMTDLAHRISLVHPCQFEYITNADKAFMCPIGTRDEVKPQPLPDEPVIGFFCREGYGGIKGSDMFEAACLQAARKVKFRVLMIGHNLEHIAYMGTYEKRGAGPKDYGRIDALVVCEKTPMVSISAYEMCAAGGAVITTPREFPGTGWDMVRQASTIDEMAELIIDQVQNRTRYAANRPFVRSTWAARQVEEAKCLVPV